MARRTPTARSTPVPSLARESSSASESGAANIAGTAYARRIAELTAAIRGWNTENIVALLELFAELRRVAEAFEQDPHWFVSQRDVPTAPLPGGVPKTKIWGADSSGLALLKDSAEFRFVVRPLSELSTLPPAAAERAQSEAIIDSLRDEPRRKITIQLKESEYVAILKAMARERETKLAAWVRRAIQRACEVE